MFGANNPWKLGFCWYCVTVSFAKLRSLTGVFIEYRAAPSLLLKWPTSYTLGLVNDRSIISQMVLLNHRRSDRDGNHGRTSGRRLKAPAGSPFWGITRWLTSRRPHTENDDAELILKCGSEQTFLNFITSEETGCCLPNRKQSHVLEVSVHAFLHSKKKVLAQLCSPTQPPPADNSTNNVVTLEMVTFSDLL